MTAKRDEAMYEEIMNAYLVCRNGRNGDDDVVAVTDMMCKCSMRCMMTAKYLTPMTQYPCHSLNNGRMSCDMAENDVILCTAC